MSVAEFLDLLGATQLIPGPNSTELAIHIGHRRAGWPGFLVAGTCFILPASLIVAAFAWAYKKYGTLPEVNGILYGIKPVIIGIILQALWGLRHAAFKSRFLTLACGTGVVLSFLGINELLILFGAGLVVAMGQLAKDQVGKKAGNMLSLLSAGSLASTVHNMTAYGSAAAVAFGIWPMFLYFLKVGSILFGSGYVLLAFLRADLVERWHWLNESQLLDAIAVGQLTPGPLFTTATFIGYLLGGPAAAIAATLGIFLPAFVFVALSGSLIPRIRRSVIAGAFLDGVNAASLALMAAVTWQLGKTALVDFTTVVLLSASLLTLVCFRLNSVWLVLGGALAGYLLHLPSLI